MSHMNSRRQFTDGEIIIRQDTIGNEMYVVESGAVRVYRSIRGVETVLEDVRTGETFGEMALFDNRPRSASARAQGETSVRIISREEFSGMKCDPIIRELLRTLSRRLRAVDDSLERLNVSEAPEREALAQLWEKRDWNV